MYYKTQMAAYKAAEQVRLQLTQPKIWAAHTWENPQGAWHFELQCGGMSLYQYGAENGLVYTALLSADPKHVGAGDIFWSPEHRTFPTPNEAVQYQLELAHDFKNKVDRCLRYLDEQLSD